MERVPTSPERAIGLSRLPTRLNLIFSMRIPLAFWVGGAALAAVWPSVKAAASASPGAPQAQWVVYDGREGPGRGKRVVLVSGDEEYRSEESLSQLGKILAGQHGFHCTVLFAVDPQTGLLAPNYHENIPGLEALKTADLMIIATRFRNLPDAQMQLIDDYLRSGRPVLGMRTATHAFKIPSTRTNWVRYDYRFNAHENWPNSKRWAHYDKAYTGEPKEWVGGFGGLVLGDTWFFHYGYHNHQSTRGLVAPGARGLALTRGLQDGEIWAPTDVYAARLPLPGDSQPIILGQTMNPKGPFVENDRFFGMRPTDDEVAGVAHNPFADSGPDRYNPNDPMMPVAWTKTYQLPGGQPGRAFTTTMGAATDLLSHGVRRLLVNAVYWCVGLEDRIPSTGTQAALVGDYNPTAFRFQSDAYWKEKAIRPADFKME